MLLLFVERCQSEKDLVGFIREFCLFLLEYIHLQWTPRLKSVFQELWNILVEREKVVLHISDDLMSDMLSMHPEQTVDIVYDFRGFLYLTEFEVDQEMVRPGWSGMSFPGK